MGRGRGGGGREDHGGVEGDRWSEKEGRGPSVSRPSWVDDGVTSKVTLYSTSRRDDYRDGGSESLIQKILGE